jgi:hypothetical protein
MRLSDCVEFAAAALWFMILCWSVWRILVGAAKTAMRELREEDARDAEVKPEPKVIL